MALELLSPAKVNLFLDLVSKRPDGFHNILTVFERIDLFDRITLEVIRSGIKLQTTSKELPNGRANIAYKAGELFLKNFNLKKGIYIKIEKNIPIAAGLGGGSSNAATVLLGACKLFGLSVTKEELLPLAKKIGSDVPFFIEETSFAIGKQRGDALIPLRTNIQFRHILVCPKVKILTRYVYSELKRCKNNITANFSNNYAKKSEVVNLCKKIGLTKNSQESINILLNLCKAILYNKLQIIVEKKVSEIARIRKALKCYGVASLMSGSGPAVFGFVDSRKEAEIIKDKLTNQYDWQIFLSKTY